MASNLVKSIELPNSWHVYEDYSLNHDVDELVALTKDEDDAIIEIFRDGESDFEVGLTVLIEKTVPLEVASIDDEGDLKDTELVRKQPLEFEVKSVEALNNKLAELIDWYEKSPEDAHDNVSNQTDRSPNIPEF